MRTRDIMTSHPLLVTASEQERADLLQLMEDARIHHLPIVEDGLLIGVWVQTADGGVVMLGRDHVHELPADADADEAVRALLRDAETVVVREAGEPVGVITRSDVLGIARTALGRGIGRRHPRPAVIRVAGAQGAGKTTLIMRSLALLGRFDVVVVGANGPSPGAAEAGVNEVIDPSAHWRAGLARVISRLTDADLIVVEDRDGELDLAHGIGEDVQVAVVPASDVAGLATESLADAQAVVVTHCDTLAPGVVQDAVADLERRCRGMEVFVVAHAHNDRGLEAWVRWVGGQVTRRRG